MSQHGLFDVIQNRDEDWAWLYFFVFPLDLLFPPTNKEGISLQELKYNELFPIFLFLLPLAVVLTNTVSIGVGGMFFLYAFIAFPLGFLSAFHLKLDAGKGIEIALNLWAGLLFVSLALFILGFVFGGCSNMEFDD